MRGPNGEDLPGAVLFACTFNSVRSPMAAAIMRHLFGKFVYVESAGVKAGILDALADEAMDEIGIEISGYKPKQFEDLEDGSFDLVITLSPEAHHRALELTRTSSLEVIYWPTFDPTVLEGSREQRMDGYRMVRDELVKKIRARFSAERGSDA
jgi:protein-tyrosine-phosphatase